MKRKSGAAKSPAPKQSRSSSSSSSSGGGGSGSGSRAQGAAKECDCEGLDRTLFLTFRNFSTACKYYEFPGSHQVGSYGPKGTGIVRTYSNATAGKDLVPHPPSHRHTTLY